MSFVSEISSSKMPAIDLSKIDLTAEERQIAERILNKGYLRASKPTIKYSKVTRPCSFTGKMKEYSEPDSIGGRAAYVWRMVAFTISPIGKHHCMPCTADFDLPCSGNYEERRALAKEMDELANKIIAAVPRDQHYGTKRWARAFGVI